MQIARRFGIRLTSCALAIAVLAGAVLRLWHLGATPLNYDESFTAMVGRLPLGSVFGFLRLHDSHPPLDYLLQLPLARLGTNAFVFRLPAALCSIAALALFAWWMRDRGRVGLVATIAMAVCAFQLTYAREARMYGPMQLIGVASAVLADAWLRAPRRRHSVIIGALTFVGLMTHISMLLLAIGLIAMAGRRRDAEAWHWRAGVAAGTVGWAVLWGPSFLTQSHGGHSSWIPHTTPARLLDTVGALVTSQTAIAALVVAVLIAGIVVCRRRDNELAATLINCFAVPTLLAGLFGLRAPVLIPRTLAVVSWGPLLALGFIVDEAIRRVHTLGVTVTAVLAALMLASIPAALYTPGPTPALDRLESVARSGDVIAIQPLAKGVELDWTFAVRSDDGPARVVRLPGLGNAFALALTGRRPTGRIWLMQISPQLLDLRHYRRCSRTWIHGPNRLVCIRERLRRFPPTSPATIAAIYRTHERATRLRASRLRA